MPRPNRYNPTPAEREAQRRCASGVSQLVVQRNTVPRARAADPFEWGVVERTNFVTSPYQPGNQPITHEDIARAAAQLDANECVANWEQRLRAAELHSQIESAVDRIQAGFRRPGDRVRLALQEPFSLNQDMAEIARLRTIDVEIDRNGRPHIDDALAYEYARITGSPGFQSSYPVPLKRRNQQPDGSLLDLTQPAEAML